MTRCYELIFLTDDFLDGNIPGAALEPCVQELRATIEGDGIARKLGGTYVDYFLDSFHTGPSDIDKARDLKACLLSITKRLRLGYRRSIEERICELYDHPKAKIELSHLLSSYTSLLINRGYSRAFIAQRVEQRFFFDSIKKVDRRTLARFCSSFSEQDITFKIFAPASPLFATYVEKMEWEKINVLRFSELPPIVQSELTVSANFSKNDKYIVYDIIAKDSYSAFSKLQAIFHSFLAFSFVHKSGIDVKLYSHAFVRRAKGKTGSVIDLDGIVFQQTTSSITKRIANDLILTSRQVLVNFSDKSADRLLSAIRTSAFSRSTTNPETQLISLWSAVEALLSSPSSGRVRITHYVDLLVPCICIRYLRGYIIPVVDELTLNYRKSLNNILAKVEAGGRQDNYSKFTHLLAVEEYKEARKELCELLSQNPLALFRVWKIRENISTYGALDAMLSAHENRIRWQLHRIYRVRNLIVHNGNAPLFLQPLVINAFEYFRSSLTSILSRGSREKGHPDIDQVVAEIGMEYSMTRKTISRLRKGRKEESLTADDVNQFFR